MKKINIIFLLIIIVIIEGCSSSDNVSSPHFDAKGNLPSSFTTEHQKKQRLILPFEDKRDFDEAKKGFIAAPAYKQIMAKDGSVAWDIGSYEWLLGDKDFNSMHPSIMRQAVLNMHYGLYEVLPSKIYQVRGFDLANITFIKGETGWIVFDPLTSTETAEAALKLINDELGLRPVSAVVISHPHGDHFGGLRGVASEEDVLDGKIRVYAPEHFYEHAVSENINAGPAMGRRMIIAYGTNLPHSPFGHVDQAIGKNISHGEMVVPQPTDEIKHDIEELTIDGIRMIFQSTPGTEAPSEMNTYFPDYKAFWAAENITGTIHNIYTLRGALVRDPMEWSKQINKALYLFGQEAEVMFASHSWPRWGNKRIQEVMRVQRDTYANLNNGVLHLANKGVSINQIHNEYEVPKTLQQSWSARSYHGSVEHNSRAVINRYLGYWDANPATLIPLSPEDSAPLYVEMMGGEKKIMKKAKSLYDEGKYLYAMEPLNKLVFAEPRNVAAKDLLADVYEQIGYQQESAALRHSFLATANELRNGMPEKIKALSAVTKEDIKALSTEMLFDYMSIIIDSKKAEGYEIAVNLIMPDVNEEFIVELSNSTLTYIEGFQSREADLTIEANRSDLEKVMMGFADFEEMIKIGKIRLNGSPEILFSIKDMVTIFDMNFELIPGTKFVE